METLAEILKANGRMPNAWDVPRIAERARPSLAAHAEAFPPGPQRVAYTELLALVLVIAGAASSGAYDPRYSDMGGR